MQLTYNPNSTTNPTLNKNCPKICKMVTFNKAISKPLHFSFYKIINTGEASSDSTTIICDNINGNSGIKLLDISSYYCNFTVSYSTDGISFSNPIPYSSDTSSNYFRIMNYLESDVYIRLYFEISMAPEVYESTTPSFSIINIDGIEYQGGGIDFNTILTSSLQNQLQWNANCIDPYANLDCAILLQQQLSDQVICMLGIPIYYFRVDPIESSRDIVFKEYTMHNVVSVKQIKLMLQDGVLPSSNHKLTEFDFDWEIDWEVEISKTQFYTVFGDKAFPKANDFIYVPMMKRMWTVNSAYDERADMLMWRSTTFKLALVKYSDSYNVVNPEGFDIDNFLTDMNIYNPELPEFDLDMANKKSGYSQIKAPGNKPDSNNLVLYKTDALRYSIDRNIKIETEIVCNSNNIIARNYYGLHKLGNNNLPGITGEINIPSIIYKPLNFSYKKGDKSVFSVLLLIYREGPNSVNSPLLDFGIGKINEPGLSLSIFDNTEGDAGTYSIGNHLIYADVLQYGTYYIVEYIIDKFTGNRLELNIYQQLYPNNRPLYTIRPEHKYFEKCTQPGTSITVPYNQDLDILFKKEPSKNSITIQPILYIPDNKLRIYKMAINWWKNPLANGDNYTKEFLNKYTTDSGECMLNDLSRPITTSEVGFNIR